VWRVGFKIVLYDDSVPKYRGEQLGFAKMLEGIGSTLGPVIGGLLIDILFLRSTFMLASILYLIGFGIMFLRK
jgi:MFS family permease